MRTNPKSFIKQLQQILDDYDSVKLEAADDIPATVPDSEITPINKLGVMRAMRRLSKAKPMSALQFDDGLFLAADDHCRDASTNGLNTDLGSASETTGLRSVPQTRVARYNNAIGVEQSMSIGAGTALDVVLQLYIKDETWVNLSDPLFKKTGVSACKYTTGGDVATIVYAESTKLNTAGQQKLAQVRKDAEGKVNKGTEIDRTTLVKTQTLLVKLMNEKMDAERRGDSIEASVLQIKINAAVAVIESEKKKIA